MLMENEFEFYSQNGEDFLLWQLFKNKTHGFYIDIGAFDGIHFSNSCFFEKQGWSGVCVEAHPTYFPLCQNNRPAAVCLPNACIGNNSGMTVTFNAEKWGLCSENTAEPLDVISKRYERRNTSFSGYTTVEINAITLNEILLQHAPVNKKIEFISVDAEWNELDILKDFNFKQWDISIFLIEVHEEAHAQHIIQLMHRNGYVLSRNLSKNYFFAKDRESITFLRYKRISCQFAADIYPLGTKGTQKSERGLKIEEISRWITPNVLSQQPHQPLWSLLDYFPIETQDPQLESARIVHIVNPYPARTEPGFGKLQKLTYDSMSSARKFDGGEIMLVSVQHQDDSDLTPEGFQRSRFLDRVVSNIAAFHKPQPLPLLFDILERGAEFAKQNDFLIYTNADIILMPFFYSAIREFIEQGFDAMNICRRTIGQHALYKDHENLARAEVGDTHPGSDCFVFSKRIFDQFIRNNACIGKEGVAKSLLLNMASTAKRMLVLRNVNLTYHIGDDREWASAEVQDYAAFNQQELQKLYTQLTHIPEKQQLLTAFINTYWQPINMQG
jgi:FkbM family methyltransferase